MKILITGSNGQLGSEIKELASYYPEYKFEYTDIGELDITNKASVEEYFNKNNPDVVINCAAYTAVDKAETDIENAFLVNSIAAANLANAASRTGVLFIHVSTDYVFDGTNHRPYKETDTLNPISVYGKSKAAGEEAVIQAKGKALIIRTSWLYSAFGNNFIKTMIKYGSERGMLNVVADQTGTPTYARDLAQTILDILPQIKALNGVEIYHYSNEGVTSWYDFAHAIFEYTKIHCEVRPISTSEYPLPASRPFYSVMDKTKIKTHFDIEIPYWRDSVKDCIDRIKTDEIISKSR